MRPEPPVIRKLAKSWLVQNLGWSTAAEALARLTLEGFFCLLLWALGVGFLAVVAYWIGFHTLVWLFLYGGYSRIRVVLGISAPTARLHAYLERAKRTVAGRAAFREIVLRGSAAGRGLSEHSDIDILFVPEKSLGSKVRGMLFMWGLRADSVLRRVPLQARWLDLEGYVPTQVIGESPVDLKGRAPKPDWGTRLASRGLLVAFSGIDGSGKTTAAHKLVSDLRSRGFDAVYFYGHRQAWYVKERPPQFSMSIGFEEVWKRIGHGMEDLVSHRRAKLVYDWLNCVDYLYVRWKLSELLRPGRIVVADRYVADVLADLALLGPVHESVAGFLLGVPFQPDVALLFVIDPADAMSRKREWPLSRLERLDSEFRGLDPLVELVDIDATPPEEQVGAEINRLIVSRLDGFERAPSEAGGT